MEVKQDLDFKILTRRFTTKQLADVKCTCMSSYPFDLS